MNGGLNIWITCILGSWLPSFTIKWFILELKSTVSTYMGFAFFIANRALTECNEPTHLILLDFKPKPGVKEICLTCLICSTPSLDNWSQDKPDELPSMWVHSVAMSPNGKIYGLMTWFVGFSRAECLDGLLSLHLPRPGARRRQT